MPARPDPTSAYSTRWRCEIRAGEATSLASRPRSATSAWKASTKPGERSYSHPDPWPKSAFAARASFPSTRKSTAALAIASVSGDAARSSSRGAPVWLHIPKRPMLTTRRLPEGQMTSPSHSRGMAGRYTGDRFS